MVMLQIRHVPDAVHRELKSRAALAGVSLSEYALAELQRGLERPTRDQLFARLRARPGVKLAVPAAALVRKERDHRSRS